METRTAGAAIRLLIVDDHDILRYGLRALLRKHADVEVVGEADSVAEAIRQAAELLPDVILMDARLPDGSGIDACREILSSHPKTRVLFFSAHSDKQTVLMTMVAGAHGHVSKDLDLAVLVDAIRTVAGGGKFIDESVRDEVAALLASTSALAKAHAARGEALSPQEERVMALVVEGKTNKEIAAALALSDKTVKNYLYNAFQKLGIGRRAQAATVFDIARLERVRRDLGKVSE
jgi:DNA-binding NarL/FixJ family response regulator